LKYNNVKYISLKLIGNSITCYMLSYKYLIPSLFNLSINFSDYNYICLNNNMIYLNAPTQQ